VNKSPGGRRGRPRGPGGGFGFELHKPHFSEVILCFNGRFVNRDSRPVRVASPICSAAESGGAAPEVWIYRNVPDGADNRSETERLFEPYGYMPAERAQNIAVDVAHAVDPSDPKRGTAVEALFALDNGLDWLGTYFLLDQGTAWATKKGIDVQKLMGVQQNAKVVLRFKAWGAGKVTFKCGGVINGPFPSSLGLAVPAKDSPVTLTDQPKEYTIGPFPARNLVNIVDPLCVVTTGLDNRGLKQVRVYIDDIRFELQARPAKAKPAAWKTRLKNTIFVAYTPTGFDPTTRPVQRPAVEEIRKDLAAIRQLAEDAGIDRRQVGITTYGCKDGLEAVAPVAKELGMAMLLGVFDPRNEDELKHAQSLLEQEDLEDTIAGVVVGNEALTFRRASMKDIESAVKRLRAVRSVPMTTTEVVQSYGDARLFSMCDFTLANAHAVFAGVFDPRSGADWVMTQANALARSAPAGHPVLIKEAGWPSGPSPFSPEQQEQFWRAMLQNPHAREVNMCFFDGLRNVDWKKEILAAPTGEQVNVGPYWPVLFDAKRKPRAAAKDLLNLWKLTRSEPQKPTAESR
jgi:exo-beta-1,3-glucanase (GH17 family)